MRLKQSGFYRKVGVRQREKLAQPKITPIDQLEMPLQSIYHFVSEDSVTIGPIPQDPLIETFDARVFIEHVTVLGSNLGNPRRTAVNPTLLVNDFRRKTRGFKPLRKDEALTMNPRNALVVNYGMMTPIYRYMASFQANYYRWANISHTLWQTVESVHKRFSWYQYVDLHLPESIPTLEAFKRLHSTRTADTLARFEGASGLNLYDLWLWLGADRQASTMAHMRAETLPYVNLLVRVKGYFFVVNLGLLDKWRKDPLDDTSKGLAPEAMQMVFVRLLHGLRDIADGTTTPEENQELVTELEGEQEIDLDEGWVAPLPSLQLPEPISPPEPPEPLVIDTSLAQPNIKYQAKAPVTVEESLTEQIVQRVEQMAEIGAITPKVHQRMVDEAHGFTKIKDPYGSGQVLGEMLAYTADDTKIPEVRALPDRATIPDKSMLSSVIKSYHQGYVKKLMKKDILNSVMAVQNLGVIVKDYKVETVRDSMNHYEIHAITVKPLKGRQSTVRFRLPVVDKDGRFISNGQKSRMRLQRSDLPLRKVKPTQVAMTSYYNKTFVDRSTRSVNDYGKWITRLLTTIGLDDDDQRIESIKLSNVFDQSHTVPRVYSMIARRIARFDSHGNHFFFDYTKRIAYFLEKTGIDVEAVEKPGWVVVGHRDDAPILMDMNNTLYINDEVLGDFPSLTGIDAAKAPLEIVEMSVSNKSIPIGLVLAYHMGLSGLLDLLGCEVTRFRRGERFALQSDEYALTFQDEVLVFTRQDVTSMMILGGLQRYHKSLNSYSVWDFDAKDVYLNVLEENGLGVRYLREIDTLFPAWIDPITKGLLEDMGEPTTFTGLLLRATEMLHTDFSPSEVDGAYMRYRGYERFAGMVYGELTRAAKLHNARSGNDGVIDLNPHQVWQRVVQDPSVTLCEDINPIQNLREQEVMTYRGDGGRGGKSMVERTRIYSDADLGVVSESTQDSGDVGVVAYLSPDPNLTSLRGQTRRYDPTKDGTSKLLSSSALNAPCMENDD